MESVSGIILDVVNRSRFEGEILIENGRIHSLQEVGNVPERYILPGFVDSHIHIESSMLVPSEFARLAVQHGTVATVSDPHEIANVCGIEGVEFMIENGRQVPLKFHFGAPSCVPATPFETAGAALDVEAVAELLDRDDIHYLAEMMNWPGVLNDDPEVCSKIESARKRNKPIDGHAPGLKGDDAAKYASAGISTDHECYTREEALDKLNNGMKIAIREGSAAKNYEALISLLGDFPESIMFCSDDKHPDDLQVGHINQLAARSLALGYNLFDVLHACCVAPVRHYSMNVGLLQPGDPADFIIVDDLATMTVSQTWIDGSAVFQDDSVNLPEVSFKPINNFVSYSVKPDDFQVMTDKSEFPVIEAYDGELITGKSFEKLDSEEGNVQADINRDILKVAVVNRYEKAPPAVGFIRNFGIKNGAAASSVAHDSHNIIVVGSSEKWLAEAVNLIMQSSGGIAAVSDYGQDVLPLPVGGIMSDQTGATAAAAYENLNRMASDMGCKMKAPFMSISFMALLVIPSLKISDKGMFDADKFEFIH